MSFIKLMNDSFIKSNENTFSKSQALPANIDQTIIEYQNKLHLIKEQYEEVKSSWNALRNDVEGLSFGNHLSNSSVAESFQKILNELKSEYTQIKNDLDVCKSTKLKLEEQTNLDTIGESIGYDLDSQAAFVLKQIRNSSNPFKTAFKYLVPAEGPAQTLAGELLRAIMNILYSFKQANEIFYLAPGIENCGSYASFLMDNGYWNDFESIVDNTMDGDLYYSCLEAIKDRIIEDILNGESITTPNNLDSKVFNKDWLNSYSNLSEGLTIIKDNILTEAELEEDLADVFLRYHDDQGNFQRNPVGFRRMYRILDQYSRDDEDVDDAFRRASEEDQIRMIELIHPRYSY